MIEVGLCEYSKYSIHSEYVSVTTIHIHTGTLGVNTIIVGWEW